VGHEDFTTTVAVYDNMIATGRSGNWFLRHEDNDINIMLFDGATGYVYGHVEPFPFQYN